MIRGLSLLFQLAKARLKFLRQNHYHARYQVLVSDPKANSDDELDPQDGSYVIKRRPERSIQAEIFFRRLDELRKSFALREGTQWRQRIRKVIPDQPMSVLHQLPRNMPIDYYSPEFYNAMSNRQKSIYCDISILSFPLDVSHILSTGRLHADEQMDDNAFYTKYASKSLAAYDLPTEEVDDSDYSDSDSAMDMDSDVERLEGSQRGHTAGLEPAAATAEQMSSFVSMVRQANA